MISASKLSGVDFESGVVATMVEERVESTDKPSEGRE